MGHYPFETVESLGYADDGRIADRNQGKVGICGEVLEGARVDRHDLIVWLQGLDEMGGYIATPYDGYFHDR